jgi:hypothetical protein
MGPGAVSPGFATGADTWTEVVSSRRFLLVAFASDDQGRPVSKVTKSVDPTDVRLPLLLRFLLVTFVSDDNGVVSGYYVVLRSAKLV